MSLAIEDEENEDVQLFWSMSLMPNKQTLIKELCEPEYKILLHITNACFGASVKNNTRTCIMLKSSDNNNNNNNNNGDDTGIPICVLSKSNENQALDLLFNSVDSNKTIFITNGENVSPVYLTGYIQYLGYNNNVKLIYNQEKSEKIEKKDEQMCYNCRAIKDFNLFDSNQTNKNKKICIQCAKKEKEIQKKEKKEKKDDDEKDDKLLCVKCNKWKQLQLFSQKERVKSNGACFECKEKKKESKQSISNKDEPIFCSECGKTKSKPSFSKTQARKPKNKRKCKQCIESKQKK